MAAQVISGEQHLVDAQLFAGRVLGGTELGEAVVAEHVQQGGLAGVVEAEEEDFAALIAQSYAVSV